MSRSPLAAELLVRKARLLQSTIAGLSVSHAVEPWLPCALGELAGEVAYALLDVVAPVAR